MKLWLNSSYIAALALFLILIQLTLHAQGMSNLNLPNQIQISSSLHNINSDEINWSDNVSFQDSTINGIDLHKLGAHREIEVPVKITNCTILGDVELGSASFFKDVSFQKTIFCGAANFGGSKFFENADFSDVYFMQDALFLGTNFFGAANFNSSQFYRDANFGDSNFDGAEFKGNSRFLDAKFYGKSLFKSASFKEKAIFDDSIFNGAASFDNANFSKGVQFLGVTFENESSFRGTKFSGFAGFIDARFKKTSDFSANPIGTTFWGNASFARSKFSEGIDFRGVSFKKDANFNQAKFEGDVDLENVSFGSTLSMNRCSFSTMRVSWDSIDQIEYDSSVYLSLIKNFNTREKFDEADRCYGQYRWLSQGKKSLSDPTFYTDIVACVTCWYGTSVLLIIFWILGLIFFGAIILWQFNGLSIKTNRQLRSKARHHGHRGGYVSKLQCLYFSAAMFIGHKPENIHALGNFEYFAMGLRLVGWFFMALFLVVLGRLLIR